MTRQFIIHVGIHKTGTSAIQKTLHVNRNNLLEAGWLYPTSCQFADHSHHKLSFDLWNVKNDDRILDDLPTLKTLEDEIIKIDPALGVIVSSEILEKLAADPHKVEPMMEMVSSLGFEPRLFAMVRRQDNLIDSVYKQWVKDSNVREHRAPCVFLNNQKEKMCFDVNFMHWERFILKENMWIHVYEVWRNNWTELISKLLGGEQYFSSGVASDIVNRTMDGTAVILKRWVNEFIEDTDLNRELSTLIVQHMSNEPKLTLFGSVKERKSYLEYFDASNVRLFERYSVVERFPEIIDRDNLISPNIYRNPMPSELYQLFSILRSANPECFEKFLNKIISSIGSV